MSLNTSHAHGGVLIYCGERILIYYDGVEFCLDPDSSNPVMKGTKKGRVYLTTHRVVFNNRDKNDGLQSFSIPFTAMRQVELEQPVFGANYIGGKVIAEQAGKWTGAAKFKMYFTKGGAIEFGQALLEAGRRATRNRVRQPPPYSPPAGPIYQAPPPAYTPMYQDPMYSFVPYQTFPTAPPADGVYMTDAPPPYPGIIEAVYPAPPPAGFAAAAPPPAYSPSPYPQQGGSPYPQQGGSPYPQQGGSPYPQQGGAAYPPQNSPYPPAPNRAPYPPPQNGGMYQQNGTPYPPPQNGGMYPQNGTPYPTGGEAKAMEAAGSAYYNPNQPHNVYMPQSSHAPPSYDQATKKTQ